MLGYILSYASTQYIRPQTEENTASRPLCQSQAPDRPISSWVGDHQRIQVAVYLLLFFALFAFGVGEVCCVKNKLLGW